MYLYVKFLQIRNCSLERCCISRTNLVLIDAEYLWEAVSELSQLIVQISDNLRFRATLWGFWTTYDVHLGFIGKRVVDFLLIGY